MDINMVATEFIEVNRRRRELEKREEYFKGILAEHFQSTKTLSLDTEQGRICYQASQRAEYDISVLREILPEPIFQLVTRLSVNDVLLSQLIKDGKVDGTKVERAKRVNSTYRVVVQSLPVKPSISPVRELSSQASSLEISRKTKKAQDKPKEKSKRSRKPKGSETSS